MQNYATFVRYFCITTTLATLIGARPLHLMHKRNYLYYNPEENIGSRLYLKEGDILIDRRRGLEFHYDDDTWRNRSVPYEFESNFGHDRMKQVIDAMMDIQNNSCITFKKRTDEKDFIRIIISVGCHSPVGRKGGAQNLSLQYEECFVHGRIQHELFHALGFWHEQSRRDRDYYIDVKWNNIKKEHHANFEMQYESQSQKELLRLPYDYGSVMHYPNNAFAIVGEKPTLVPLTPVPRGVVMGQRTRFSPGDIDKLNALYRCDVKNCTDPGPLSFGYVNGNGFRVGSRLRYNCQPGYILVGAPERVCLDMGQWSGDPPACLTNTPGRSIYYWNFDTTDNPWRGWTPGPNNHRNWILKNGPTPTKGTGPNNDHTWGTDRGTYAYLESSHGHQGLKSTLMSPPFQMSSRYRTCLTFFTCMYGKNMGNLTVYMKEDLNSTLYTNPQVVFSLTGEQGRSWNQVFLVLGEMMNPFTIFIEATTGKGYMNDIAIDDIIIGDCSLLKPVAISGYGSASAHSQKNATRQWKHPIVCTIIWFFKAACPLGRT